MTSAGVAAASASTVGYVARNLPHAGSTRFTFVCWAMTSETRTEYGSRVERKLSVLPRSSYQARTAAWAPDASDGGIGPSVPSPDARSPGRVGFGPLSPARGIPDAGSDRCRVLGPANGLAVSARGGDRCRRRRG